LDEKISILSAAMKYRSMGFSVIPLRKNTKEPAVKWETYQREIASEEKLIEWFTGDCNIGIVTGELSNLTVVDCDTKDAILAVGPMLPPDVPSQKTPRGGRHFFFKYTKGFVNRAHIAPGVDIRTQGGYVAAYPSTMANGGWNW
jgi:hypothetical protein